MVNRLPRPGFRFRTLLEPVRFRRLALAGPAPVVLASTRRMPLRPKELLTVTLFATERVPVLPVDPPRIAPPASTLTAPDRVPLPPRVAPLLTPTLPAPVPLPEALFANSVPALTVVP